jgi:5-methylthioribose kinase
VKQALPYVRVVGKSWPMTVKRTYFEYEYIREQTAHVNGRMPQLYHYEPTLYAIVMERLAPHLIMRRGIIQGRCYPAFAEHVSDFMARSLFFTSDLAMPAGRKKMLMAIFCSNTELCKITEDLIFTDPYRVHDRNRWTAPELDSVAAEIRADRDLKLAISRLKMKFLSSAEALIHGDLHTGSIMVTEHDTRVIDAEFAFVGPIGFDVGAVIANLLLAFFSQHGHANATDLRGDYEDWLLNTVEQIWTLFSDRFLALWRDQAGGDGYPKELFEGPDGAGLEEERQRWMRRVYFDALGFAAAKMIRRILGFAHVIDFEQIAERQRRALCELRALRLARDMMVNPERYSTIAMVTGEARRLRLCETKEL